MEALVVIVGVIVLFLIIMGYGPLVYGFLLYKYWSWFIIPVFPILPEISYWNCVGLYIVIMLCKPKSIDITAANKKSSKDTAKEIVSTLTLPWIILLISYIFKCIIYGS